MCAAESLPCAPRAQSTYLLTLSRPCSGCWVPASALGGVGWARCVWTLAGLAGKARELVLLGSLLLASLWLTERGAC